MKDILEVVFKILTVAVIPLCYFLAKVHTRLTVLEGGDKNKTEQISGMERETSEHGKKIAMMEEAVTGIKTLATEIRNDLRTMKDLVVATQALAVSSEKRLEIVEERVWENHKTA